MRNEQQIKAILGQINDLFGFNVTQGLEMASSQPIFHLQVLRGVEQFVKVFPMIIEEVALITTTEVANNIMVKRLCETGNCSYQVAKRICRRVAPAKSNAGAYMVAMYKNDSRRIVAFSHHTKKEMEQVLKDIAMQKFGRGMFHYVCHEFTHVLVHALKNKSKFDVLQYVIPFYNEAVETRRNGDNNGLSDYAFTDPEEFLCEIVGAYVFNPDYNELVRNVGDMFKHKVNDFHKKIIP